MTDNIETDAFTNADTTRDIEVAQVVDAINLLADRPDREFGWDADERQHFAAIQKLIAEYVDRCDSSYEGYDLVVEAGRLLDGGCGGASCSHPDHDEPGWVDPASE